MANLKKREDEHAAAIAELNSRHDAATEDSRQAHTTQLNLRLQEMHSADRKSREDLDAADR